MRLSAQNLNGDYYHGGHGERPAMGSMVRHGRAWLYFGTEWVPKHLGCEWHLLSGRWGISLDLGGEDDFVLGLSFGLASFYLHAENVIARRRLPKQEREVRVSLHDGGLWWSLWMPSMESSSREPWYRRGHFDPIDFLLGGQKHRRRTLEVVPVEVPMPERTYQGQVTIFESTWKRKRWPWPKRMVRTEIEVEGGVPFPGKGENDYDQDQDAVYSLTSMARTPAEAVAELVKTVLRNRERYGGSANWRPEEVTA